jgi:hypothetical protein
LNDAHPVSFSKGVFTIGFAPERADHLPFLERNQTLLQTKLQELGHAGVQFRFVKAAPPADRVPASALAATAPAPAPAAPVAKAPAAPAVAKAAAPTAAAPKEAPAPVPFDKDTFKNDPLIQKALEVFKGQIVEVRA